MIWLDGLDLPLVHLLESVFYEPFPEDLQPVTRPADETLKLYGNGGLPRVGRHLKDPILP